MTLQLPERTAQDVTNLTGRLLLYLLTLTSHIAGRLFSSAFPLPSPTPCTLTSGMLSVARTFLILLVEQATDRPTAFSRAKIQQSREENKINVYFFITRPFVAGLKIIYRKCENNLLQVR